MTAGTMGFLLDDEGSLSFMEMNARIQVEHPRVRDGHERRFDPGADPGRVRRSLSVSQALSEFQIEGRGLKTTIRFHGPLLADEHFRSRVVTTDFVEQLLAGQAAGTGMRRP
jgi:acetyl/propionyl-CoA carboxylase alpha subunit